MGRGTLLLFGAWLLALHSNFVVDIARLLCTLPLHLWFFNIERWCTLTSFSFYWIVSFKFLWVGFLNLSLTNIVFSFLASWYVDIKLRQNERWGIFKFLFQSFCYIISSAFCVDHDFRFLGFLFLFSFFIFLVSCKIRL